jgi:hypothetical protein
MIDLKPWELGALLHYSMRYAMGRFTYAVDDVTRFIREHWNDISDDDRRNIATELEREVRERANIGDPWQRELWTKLRDFAVASATEATLRRQMQEGE